jgi:ParB family chromosome partitioning protein
LIPELLEKVDNDYVSFTPAIELSYLKENEQIDFCKAMEYADCPPSLSQAQRIRKLSKINQATMDAMLQIMSEEKKVTFNKIVIKYDDVRRFFPENCSSNDMQKKIIQLLEEWNKKA